MSTPDETGWMTLKLRPEGTAVRFARAFAVAAADDAGLGGEIVEDVRLACSEAVTNAVHASRVHSVSEPLQVRCATSPGELTVQVIDHGGGFEPQPARDVGELRIGGYGLPVMRGLAADMRIDRMDDGSCVTMVFRS